MLEDYFTKRITISRKTVTGNKTAFSTVSTDIAAHIQPMSPTYANGQWGRLQKEYRLLSNTEVKIGDKIEDEAGEKYEVFGVVGHSFRIGRRHYEALLRGV